jgi:hypothetical protein
VLSINRIVWHFNNTNTTVELAAVATDKSDTAPPKVNQVVNRNCCAQESAAKADFVAQFGNSRNWAMEAASWARHLLKGGEGHPHKCITELCSLRP